jgi:hypothetical protein
LITITFRNQRRFLLKLGERESISTARMFGLWMLGPGETFSLFVSSITLVRLLLPITIFPRGLVAKKKEVWVLYDVGDGLSVFSTVRRPRSTFPIK